MAQTLVKTAKVKDTAPVSKKLSQPGPLQLSANISPLRRQTSCACGGGCPRCQGTVASTSQLTASVAGDRAIHPGYSLVNSVVRQPKPFTQSQFKPAEAHGMVHGQSTLPRTTVSVQTLNTQIPVLQRQANIDDPKFMRSPPGTGAYSEADYKRWQKRHPKSTLSIIVGCDSKRYTPRWFWQRDYFYSGRMGLGRITAEIWLKDSGGGREYRVLRDPDATCTERKSNESRGKDTGQASADETAALDEAQIYAQDYVADKIYLTSRADELKELETRSGSSSEEYIDLYSEFREEEEAFRKKYEFILNSRIFELWGQVSSQNGMVMMGQYSDTLEDFRSFDPYDDVVPGLPDVPPIDLSGGP